MSGIPIGVRLGKPRVEQNESALPQIADMKATWREVCVGPLLDSCIATNGALSSLDHLVGARKQRLPYI